MSKTEEEMHQAGANRFIGLANELVGEGNSKGVVSHAMMTASALYATYAVTGNTGGLTESGVDKTVAVFRKHLERVQKIRRAEDEQRKAAAQGEA